MSSTKRFIIHKMPGTYHLTLKRASSITFRNAIFCNRQFCRVPNLVRMGHWHRNKRFLYTGETGTQQPSDVITSTESSQASSSEQSQSESNKVRPLRQISLDINGKRLEFDSLRLRDACPCERCIDRSTTQKLFDTLDIPADIQGIDQEVYPDRSFSISWTSDVPGYVDHRSYYPYSPNFASSMTNVDAMVKKVIRRKHPRILWDQKILENRQLEMNVTYNEYMTDEKVYRSVIQELFQYGIAFVKNVPNSSESVAEIGERMGGVRNTIYGPAWDVKALPSAKNVASTSSDLGFHMVSQA